MTPARILVVDDEPGMREGCRRILAAEGYAVETAADGQAGLDAFLARPGFDAVLVDLKMPRMGGLDLAEHIRRHDPDVLILVITAYAAIETAVEATKRGAYGYIPKPFTPDELLLPVRNGLHHRALAVETRRLREEAERHRAEMENARFTFISMVAHELRSPLAAIEGCIDAVLASAKDLSPEDRALLARALARAGGLRNMVGEMLSLTALHSGNFVLRAAPLLIAELLREALAAHGPAAAGKRITLHSELPTPGPTVTADRDALRSVFANLIDNALKYTPAGGRVTVALALDAQAAVITVTDTGIGMTPQEQARAFEEFYRARNPATANVPGTGLGLTLVKRLVELHSGTVTLRSAPGHGATFTLSLPLAPSTA
jgi:signal transduction histidine kinase